MQWSCKRLRTPLNAIIGLTEMMVTNAPRFGTEKALEPLRRVNAAGTHLLSLINEVLDLSKIEAGKLGAFSQGLSELGWSIGRNVRIDYRWYAGNADAARKYAGELVALSPDVILAAGTPGVTAIQQDTDSVPKADHIAQACSSRLLSNAMVGARIAEIMAVGAERAEVTAEEVIRELKKLGRFHGGLSTGPKTAAGRARIAEAQRRRWNAWRGGHLQ